MSCWSPDDKLMAKIERDVNQCDKQKWPCCVSQNECAKLYDAYCGKYVRMRLTKEDYKDWKRRWKEIKQNPKMALEVK